MTKVYNLNNYPPEIIATAFAKTSRSNKSFTEIIKNLNEDKSAKFQEKWVIEYSHSSISEHAITHIAIEQASRIVLEIIESGRLASYTEQSTRYQKIPQQAVYRDEKWSKKFLTDYNDVIDMTFQLYNELLAQENRYDVARFALPLAALANVGLTINMRSLRRTICKLLASEHNEAKVLAKQLLKIGKDFSPTLLKHINPCETTKRKRNLRLINKNYETKSDPISVELYDYHVDLNKIKHLLAYSENANILQDKEYESFMEQLDIHDALPRAFEHGLITFKIKSDYGSYYDMKRHRIATLITSPKLCNSFIIPKSTSESNFVETMKKVQELYNKWSHLPESTYMLTNAFQKEYLLTVNPRELFEIIRLRGLNKNGHSSYRAIGLKMFELVMQKTPDLFKYINNWQQDNKTSKDMLKYYKNENSQV